MFCVVCQQPIPPERKWDSITCSPACSKTRKDYGRVRAAEVACKYCHRPATLEERARYKRWRAWEKKNPPAEVQP